MESCNSVKDVIVIFGVPKVDFSKHRINLKINKYVSYTYDPNLFSADAFQ